MLAVNIQPFQVLNWSQLLHDAVGSAAPIGFRILEHPVSNWPFSSLVTSWMTCYSSGDESTSLNQVCLKNKIHHWRVAFTYPHLQVCAWFGSCPQHYPGSAQLLSWWGFSIAKGVAPLSPFWGASPATHLPVVCSEGWIAGFGRY